MHSLCTHYTLTIHSLCTHYALTIRIISLTLSQYVDEMTNGGTETTTGRGGVGKGVGEFAAERAKGVRFYVFEDPMHQVIRHTAYSIQHTAHTHTAHTHTAHTHTAHTHTAHTHTAHTHTAHTHTLIQHTLIHHTPYTHMHQTMAGGSTRTNSGDANALTPTSGEDYNWRPDFLRYRKSATGTMHAVERNLFPIAQQFFVGPSGTGTSIV
jgi:hypothetical protein